MSEGEMACLRCDSAVARRNGRDREGRQVFRGIVKVTGEPCGRAGMRYSAHERTRSRPHLQTPPRSVQEFNRRGMQDLGRLAIVVVQEAAERISAPDGASAGAPD